MSGYPTIQTIEIIDPLDVQDQMAIEVHILLSDNTERWCFFCTHESLANFGDSIDGTTTRFHHGAEHMIVVARTLSKNLIEAALRSVEHSGDLLHCTRCLHGESLARTECVPDLDRSARASPTISTSTQLRSAEDLSEEQR